MTDPTNHRVSISFDGGKPIETDMATIKRAAAGLGPRPAVPGDNSGDPPPRGGETGGIAAAKLRSFVERIERLETEKADLSADIKDVFAEAKGNGFDTKIMRRVIQLRKLEEPDRKEQDELLDLYRRALEV